MSNYLIELLVIHSVLVLGYWFFLRKEQQYAKMRFYLIVATLLALIIPALKLPRLFSSTEPMPSAAMEAIPLDAMTVTATTDRLFWDDKLLIQIYLVVSLFFLLKFVLGIIYLFYLERKSSYVLFDGLYIRKVSNIAGSFSFFNWIFLSEETNLHGEENAVILQHEKAHSRLGHSYDIVFFDLFRACFWWLPTAWFLRKEIKIIHEYQADAYALKSYDIDRYSSVLISATLKTNGLSLASSFHDGLILKRLTAMKKQVKNVSPWKIATLSLLGVSLFVVFACTEELDEEIKRMGNESNAITFEQLPLSMQNSFAEIKGELSFVKVNMQEGDQQLDMEELQNIDPELIYALNVDKDNNVIYMALKKDGANFDYLANQSKTAGETFTVVEEQPSFEGGMDAFYRYIASEMKYPLQARQQGIEGRIFVQFVVEKDGSLSDVQAIKGIGSGCDDEAVRVIQNAPSFKPGKQRGKPVRVRMVMPITFKLDGQQTDEANSQQGTIKIEDAQQQKGKLKVDASFADGAWSGTIYNQEGDVLPGANIIVAGSTTGTVSDLDGTFKVSAPSTSELYVTFVGYESLRIKRE
jgi:TonB family protein